MMRHYHKNPRNITKQQQVELKSWLEEFGDLSGIVHNLETDELIGGNMRADALEGIMSGLIQPVIVKEYDEPTEQGTVAQGYFELHGEMFNYRQVRWDDETAERANLIANKAGGFWDWDILANDFDVETLLDSGFSEEELLGEDFDLGEEEHADAEPQIDRAEELREKWGVETGQMWQVGDHRIICGDCTDAGVVARVMGGEKAVLTHTDPPYNVDYGASKNPRHKIRIIENDALTDEDWHAFVHAWGEILKEFTMGDVYVWGAPSQDGMRMRLWLIEMGLHWSATIVWKKQQLVLSPAKYQRMYEPCLYGWFGKKSSFSADRKQTEVWEVDRPHNSKYHPTMKPIELCEIPIRNSSEIGDIVLDIFNGSGSTMLACQNLGRKCRAVEISPAYVAVTLERMATAFPDIDIRKIE